MLSAQTQTNRPTLEEVKYLFEQWRKERKRCEPIPPLLWDKAISLAECHPLHEISTCLRLNYNNLKNRAQKSAVIPPTFIELPGILPAECTVELEKPSGEQMRVRGRYTIAEMIRAFFP